MRTQINSIKYKLTLRILKHQFNLTEKDKSKTINTIIYLSNSVNTSIMEKGITLLYTISNKSMHTHEFWFGTAICLHNVFILNQK